MFPNCIDGAVGPKKKKKRKKEKEKKRETYKQN